MFLDHLAADYIIAARTLGWDPTTTVENRLLDRERNEVELVLHDIIGGIADISLFDLLGGQQRPASCSNFQQTTIGGERNDDALVLAISRVPVIIRQHTLDDHKRFTGGDHVILR